MSFLCNGNVRLTAAENTVEDVVPHIFQELLDNDHPKPIAYESNWLKSLC